MNNHQKSRARDRLIIETLEAWGALDTNQIRILFFPSLRMAQRRMNLLVKNKKVYRKREDIALPNWYYVKKPKDIEYAIRLNWIRIMAQRKFAFGDRLEKWEYLDGPDAQAMYYNRLKDTYRTLEIYYQHQPTASFAPCQRIIITDSQIDQFVEELA
jgi:hypothetical protein